MLNRQLFDKNEIKQQYRKLSMDYENDPQKLQQLNQEYESFVDGEPVHQNMCVPNVNQQPNVMNTLFHQGMLGNHEPNMMIVQMSPDEEAKMMKSMMQSMPDILSLAFDMKKKYNESEVSKQKQENVFENFMDFLTVGAHNLPLPEHFTSLDEHFETQQDMKEDIHETLFVSLYDIYKNEQITLNYKSNVYKNDVNCEKINNCKMIKLGHNIHDNYIIKFKNEGNQYIVKHKGTQYSDLIVKFKIKENDELNSSNVDFPPPIAYFKEDYDYHINIRISYPESILGFKRTILLLNGNETLLNVNSNGKIIYHKDKKMVKNRGFMREDEKTHGNMIIHFHVLPYEIKDFESHKKTLENIFA